VLVGATAVATVVLSLAASGPRTVARLEDGAVVATAGPFPGWLWTVPVLASGLVAAALSEGVLRLVALRPAVDDVAEDWDMWLRRRTARHTLRTVQCVLGLELAGLIALAGMALRWLGMGVSGNGWNTIAPQSTTFVALGNVVFWFAVAIALTVLTATLRPARDPAPRPAAGQTRGAVHS